VCSVCVSASAATTTQNPQPAQASVTPTAQAQTPAATPTEQPLTPTLTKEPSPTVTPLPTQAPTPPPPPASTPTSLVHTGVNGNPWGYSFQQGNSIYDPPADFCSGQYFSCISSFEHGTGSVVECSDGLYSKSGGHKGSRSKHGGEQAILYSH
jgi:hypothetical protein